MISGVVIISGMLLAFLLNTILARNLGNLNFGVYTYVMSLVSLVGLGGQIAVPNLLVREASKYKTRKEYHSITKLFSFSKKMMFLQIFITIFVSFFIYWRGSGLAWLWVLILAPLLSFSKINASLLNGLGMTALSQLYEKVLPLLVIVVSIFILLMKNIELTLSFIFIGTVVVYLITSFFTSYMLGKIGAGYSVILSPESGGGEEKLWVGSLFSMVLISAIQLINSQGGIYILVFFGEESSVAIYKIAFVMLSLTGVFIIVINYIIAPKITSLYQQEKGVELQYLLTKSARICFLTTVIFFAFFIFFGNELIIHLYGLSYQETWELLLIACVGELISSLLGFSSLALKQFGYEKIVLSSLVRALFINISFSIFLYMQYGLKGIVIAGVISRIYWNFANWQALRKVTGVDASALKIFK